MTRQRRQTSKKSKAEQLDAVVRFINAGKTQAEAAAAAGVNVRTVQRWLTEPQVKTKLSELQQRTDAIVKSDPVVLSVTEVRQQVSEILQYRESQLTFALEMGQIIQKTSAVLLKAVERLEANPEELSVRSIPPLMRALTDAAEKVSNAWARTTGLDDLLQQIGQVDEQEPDS
jgi:transposase